MSFADFERRLNQAALDHLIDGTGTYVTAAGDRITDIPYIVDRRYQAYDDQGLAMYIKTISVPPDRVPDHDDADRFEAAGEVYELWTMIEDDGVWRRMQF